MPALLPVAGVARVACRGTAAGQAIVNVFHVRCGAGSMSQAQIDFIALTMHTAYTANFVPKMNGLWSGDTITAVDLSSNTGVSKVQALGGTPGATSQVIPLSAACCVTWNISRHYRGGHPRTYIGPMTTGCFESPTRFTTIFQTAMNTAAGNFLSTINGATVGGEDLELVAVHRVRNGAQLATPEVSVIAGADVDARIDTMRRRLGRDI